jgi:uncharacterized protein
MKCPVDDTILQMTNREGVEIDYCPTCRGVWLDRGELDKIIEQSVKYFSQPQQNLNSQPTPPIYNSQPVNYPNQNNHGYNNQSYPHNNQHYPKKKKESWLGDLFDF